MDLSSLRYLDAVARHGSLTAAAKALRVAQPTLTLAMRNLEKRFGTTLLIRSRTGVTLTPAGEELLRHAHEIFAALERAEQTLHGLQSDEVGRFVLGCHESLGAYFLPGFMSDFLESAPRIELALWNGSSASVSEAIVRREVHFGLIVNPVPHPDLVLVELFQDAMDIFVLAPAAATPGEAAARLTRGPLVYAPRVTQCQQLIARLAGDGVLPERLLTVGDLELTKSLALGGLGVALLPRRVAAYGQPGRLKRLHPSLPFIPDTIYLAFRGDAPRTRGFLRVKEALVAHGRRLGPSDSDAPAGQASARDPDRTVSIKKSRR